MFYRRFGTSGWDCSILGFGAMRLPTKPASPHIDDVHATKMLHYAIDHGVNYVDTAYPYHDGESERFLGRALQGGYREEVHLASKLPAWMVKERGDCDRFLEEQLRRLKTDKLDLYLLHALNAATWENMVQCDVVDWMEQRRSEGTIGQIGFSFHDELEVFLQIVEATDAWDFCQIQYNFMDVAYQAGQAGLQHAHQKGLAVVVMEPLHGGQLAKRVPDSIRAIWTRSEEAWDPVEWALRWVWDQPEVSLLLSGMSTLDQVKQNVEIAGKATSGSFSPEKLALVDEVRQAYRRLSPIPCTRCGYCQPCPSGVVIPRILELYNNATMYQEPEESTEDYLGLDPEEKADQCVKCGSCEEKCPQRISIMEWLESIHTFFTAGNGES